MSYEIHAAGFIFSLSLLLRMFSTGNIFLIQQQSSY